ncbi:hypothetical protein ACJIZ3_013734 [Penstemon smallii]|uniref:CREG-like beta-barrel domain-containing protein n=1 Tax=Penstemon smallii TaxID=265156 RepID=A0ABD3RKZ6_9LAMI
MVVIIISSGAVLGLDRPRPDPNQAAAFARWLVAEVDWCVLTTIDSRDSYLFGNVISYTDGATGVPYFYLTRNLDPTGRNAIADPNASFTISEKVLGTCGNQDPQSPVFATYIFLVNDFLTPKDLTLKQCIFDINTFRYILVSLILLFNL